MKKYSIVCSCLLLIFSPFFSIAQIGIVWQKWPAALQLYPRDDQNKAEVPIAGRLQSVSYSHASVWVYKNNTKWKYLRTAVSKNGGESRFQFTPTIEAGLHQYKFVVYAVAGGDSVLVDTRDNIVCGDVILCMGQSNLTGFYPNNYSYRNNFVRAFGNSAGAVPDTVWRLSNIQEGQVGLIATEIQRLILEKHGMPTCLINGSVGGTSIKSHIARNAANPADPQTLYGRLLYWARKAGVANKVKAFIWRQGENEAGGGSAIGYEQDIQTLFGYWQTDYPNVGKFYVVQNNLLPDANKGASQLRDFQRRTPQLFPRTEAIATVGLPAYGGVHYGPEGQYQFASEVFRLIARDVYNSSDLNGIASPSIRKAYYKTAEKKEVVLEFEAGQNMVWKQDTVVNGVTQDIRDFIYFDYANVQQERVIESGTAEGNRITLKLTKPISATGITYLPNHFKTPFGGPFLKNSRGMRAFTFHKVTIEAASGITPPVENPPPTDPVVVTPPPAQSATATNPPGTNYGGSLDGASCDNIWGWVYNKDYPNAPITVEFLVNTTVVGTVTAAHFRQDLKNANKGNGEHGFNFLPPASLKTGQNQAIKARVVGTNYFLPGGPKNLTCANTGTPPPNPPVENPPPNDPPVVTPPPAQTVTTTNPPGTNYGGNLDGARCDNIWGWVFHKDYPNAPITVEFLANNVVVGTVTAAHFRQDLKNAKKGNGEHGFNFLPPNSLLNGQNQSIKVRVVGTNYFLPGGPKNMTCTNSARLSAETVDESLAVMVYPNPSAGRLHIRLFVPEKQVATLRMTDLSGRLVWQQAVTGDGNYREEVVDVPEAVVQAVVVSAQVGNRKAVKKVLLNR